MLILIAAHVCPVPAAAYRVVEQAHISRADKMALESYTQCVCGPEGVNDAPEVPDKHGRYIYDPKWACERYGWNSHRYVHWHPQRMPTPAHVIDSDWSKLTDAQVEWLNYEKCGARGADYWDDGGPVCRP